ncbi:MAG: NADH-quinone oxidoreductase subunit N [Candidatus Marinimicrobia bacterium]|nr:NADH-quinone oxidoreductase subunit N [Candidatus Neomarinimicrobiota bacterium]
MNNLQSLSYYWPEIILTVTILVAIIADLFYSDKDSGKTALWVLGGLILAQIAIYIQDSEIVTTLFMGNLAFDPFASFFKTLIVLATILVIFISQKSSELDGHRTGEYYSLMAIMVFGMFLMASAIDLIMLYLAIEIVSIVSFILAGYLKGDLRSNEAALKYVIYGAFSTGIMLFGMSIIFGLAGSTKFFAIQEAMWNLEGSAQFAFTLAAIFILAGFGYKISAVPFHFWTPDVYEGAPTPITAYLSVAPKAVGFAVIIRFFNTVFGDSGAFIDPSIYTFTTIAWPQLLAVLSVITMTLGNLVALQQNSIKRMLAYSSIAHAGYMLMAIPTLSSQGVYAIMLYLVMYLFMNLGAFFVVIYVKSQGGGESFDDFKGLGWKMPIVGIVMTVFMLSLTGIPPTAGFIGKFYIFASVIKVGPQMYWLAVVGAINSVISLYYYFRVVKVMFLEGEPSETIIVPSPTVLMILFALAIPTVFFGIYWAPIADWVSRSLTLFIKVI